ncbi:hypothetical protein K7X08_032619 [Anisodus acutangulus]|uniref:Uncharacterized protein n=1 Tax=Anisodus acutangulus TaxID=402998 RepID=A0A9Q1LZV1_9SOLA|nr:hypothetical protein K7X08_032619 [Anisodus acutangulus]
MSTGKSEKRSTSFQKKAKQKENQQNITSSEEEVAPTINADIRVWQDLEAKNGRIEEDVISGPEHNSYNLEDVVDESVLVPDKTLQIIDPQEVTSKSTKDEKGTDQVTSPIKGSESNKMVQQKSQEGTSGVKENVEDRNNSQLQIMVPMIENIEDQLTKA